MTAYLVLIGLPLCFVAFMVALDLMETSHTRSEATDSERKRGSETPTTNINNDPRGTE